MANDNTTCKRLIEQFRSEHADLFPADIPNPPATEFLDHCAVVFQCTRCGSVYHFKDARSHGAECPQVTPSSWSIGFCAPARRNIVVLVLNLLEILGLPQNTTLEALKDVRFSCLCGDPRYEGHFDFQGLLDHVISENQEYDEIKSKILGKTRSNTTYHSLALSDAQLINDHDSYALTSKIVRIDHEELGYAEAVGGFSTQSQRVPTRKKWDHCEICLQLTGTKIYFGGDMEFKRYHLSAKHGHDAP